MRRGARRKKGPSVDLNSEFWQLFGIEVQGIELRQSGSGLRGCYTTHPLNKDTVIIRVPQKTAIVEFFDELLAAPKGVDWNIWVGIGSYARIAFELLQRAEFKEILLSLPRFPDDVSLPMFWDTNKQHEFTRLCATSSEKIEVERRHWDHAWRVLQGPLSSRGLTKDDLFTALHAVCTRSFDGETNFFGKRSWAFFVALTLCIWIIWIWMWFKICRTMEAYHLILPAVICQLLGTKGWLAPQLDRTPYRAFIPGLDMLNHSSAEPSVILKFDQPSCEFQVCCRMPVPANCEVRYSYVDSTNDELLLRFGFVEEDNPNDVLEVSVEALNDIDNISEEVSKLKVHGYDRLRFQRRGAVADTYVNQIGWSSIRAIARQLKLSIEEGLGDSENVLRRYKREKIRLLDETLSACCDQQTI